MTELQIERIVVIIAILGAMIHTGFLLRAYKNDSGNVVLAIAGGMILAFMAMDCSAMFNDRLVVNEYPDNLNSKLILLAFLLVISIAANYVVRSTYNKRNPFTGVALNVLFYCLVAVAVVPAFL